MIKYFKNIRTLKSAIWILISNIILAFCNWGQLALLTKKLDLYTLGIYTLSLAISAPIFQFFNLQLRVLYVTHRDKKFNFTNFFTLRIISSLIVLFIAFILSFILFNDFFEIKIFLFVFVLYIIDAIIDIFNAKLHYNQKLIEISYSTILRSLMGFIGFVIGVFLFKSVVISLLLGILFKCIGLYFYDYNLFKKERNVIKVEFDKKVFELAKWALPMGLGLLISSLNINISRYFVNFLYGVEIQGVYSTLSYLIVIGNMFIGTFGNVILPKLAILYSDKKYVKMSLLNNYFLGITFVIGLALFLGSYFFGDFLIPVIFSDKIVNYSYLLAWIMGSAIFNYLSSAIGFTLTASNLIRQQAYIGVVVLMINLLLNILFYKNTSIQLITIFVGISFFVQFAISYYLFIKKIRNND